MLRLLAGCVRRVLTDSAARTRERLGHWAVSPCGAGLGCHLIHVTFDDKRAALDKFGGIVEEAER